MLTAHICMSSKRGHLEDAAAELVKVGADAQLDVGGGHRAGRQAPPKHWQQLHVGPREIKHCCRHLPLTKRHNTPLNTSALPWEAGLSHSVAD